MKWGGTLGAGLKNTVRERSDWGTVSAQIYSVPYYLTLLVLEKHGTAWTSITLVDRRWSTFIPSQTHSILQGVLSNSLPYMDSIISQSQPYWELLKSTQNSTKCKESGTQVFARCIRSYHLYLLNAQCFFFFFLISLGGGAICPP